MDGAVRKRGRPPKSLQAQHSDIPIIVEAGPNGMRNSSGNREYGYVTCACGRHGRVMQVRSAIRHKQRKLGSGVCAPAEGLVGWWFYCKVCDLPKGVLPLACLCAVVHV